MTPTGFSQMLLLHSSSTTFSMTPTAFSLKYCLLYYFNQIPLHLACTQLYLLKYSLLYSSSTVFSMTPTGFSQMLLLHSSSTTLSMTPTAFSLKYCLLYYFNQVPLHSAWTQLYLLKYSLLYSSSTVFSDTNWIFSNVVTSFKFNYIKYDLNCIFSQLLFTLLF